MDDNSSSIPAAKTPAGWFGGLPVRAKVLAIAVIGAVTAVLITVVALVSLSAQQDAVKRSEQEISTANQESQAMERYIWNSRLQVNSTRATVSASINEELFAEFEQNYSDAVAQAELLWSHFDSQYKDEVMTSLESYRTLVLGDFKDQTLRMASANAERIRINELNPAGEGLLELFDKINQEIEQFGVDSTAQAAQSARLQNMVVIAVAVLGSLLALGLGLMIANHMVRDIQSVRDALRALSSGDFTSQTEVASRDEIGEMAQALEEVQENLREILSSVVETSEQAVSENIVLSAISQQLAMTIEQTSKQAAIVASAAEQISTNVQNAASGSEQMSASIREIAQNAQEATAVARTAASTAEATNVTVSRLGESSREIGDVIKSITSIAEQTNLLALNATIEAARAGEAGKGFAVVAGEVKELAAESARAAEDVARRVEAIQNDTNSAVSAIAQIAEIVESINNYQMTIASAVEEQTATTNEMSRSVAEAATGSTEIAGNINEVAANVNQSGPAFDSLDEAITKVSSAAKDLSARVQVFRF
ncbi:methyl-accepting chemotaxis protein [Populibacterium corticicola]|uniref:Methyl-accepting chemotaxis protein n=1 Tax=Populibacterium corticicola TaxID=1812826 RepID=A0ABW5XBI4_9MICO